MHAFNATYLINKVSYAKTDFAILFSTERAFSRSIDFSFQTFLCYKSAAVLWKSLFLQYRFRKPITGNIWDNKVFK